MLDESKERLRQRLPMCQTFIRLCSRSVIERCVHFVGRSRHQLPAGRFQRLTAFCEYDAAASRPSAENATERTACGAGKLRSTFPEATSHSRIATGWRFVNALKPPVSRRRLSAEKPMDWIISSCPDNLRDSFQVFASHR